jgi:hypothetical protein
VAWCSGRSYRGCWDKGARDEWDRREGGRWRWRWGRDRGRDRGGENCPSIILEKFDEEDMLLLFAGQAGRMGKFRRVSNLKGVNDAFALEGGHGGIAIE